ncbi:Glycoprotein endo-alpha-1,2-mannosidase-like protein [Plecturocebus cupreus]
MVTGNPQMTWCPPFWTLPISATSRWLDLHSTPHPHPTPQGWDDITVCDNIKYITDIVGPGCTDTSIRPWNNHSRWNRVNGKDYDRALQAALTVRPKISSTTSFNEQPKGIQMEKTTPNETPPPVFGLPASSAQPVPGADPPLGEHFIKEKVQWLRMAAECFWLALSLGLCSTEPVPQTGRFPAEKPRGSPARLFWPARLFCRHSAQRFPVRSVRDGWGRARLVPSPQGKQQLEALRTESSTASTVNPGRSGSVGNQRPPKEN